MGTLQNLINSFSRDPARRQTQFAETVVWFLRNDPLYREELRTVWLKKDYPGPGWEGDQSTDILAETQTGEIWAIQSKLVDRNSPITRKDIEGFLGDSARAEVTRRLIVTSAEAIAQDAEQEIAISSTPQPSSGLAQAIPVEILLRGDLERRRRRRRRRRDEEESSPRDEEANWDWPSSIEILTLPQRLEGLSSGKAKPSGTGGFSPSSFSRNRLAFAVFGAVTLLTVVLVLNLRPGASHYLQDDPSPPQAVVPGTPTPVVTPASEAKVPPSATPPVEATAAERPTAKPAPVARPNPTPANPVPTKSAEPVTRTPDPVPTKPADSVIRTPTKASARSSATVIPTATTTPTAKLTGKPSDQYACRISREGYCLFTGTPHKTGLKPGTKDIVDRNGESLFRVDEAAAANEEGQILEAQGKPAADGDDLIKFSQEAMTDDEKAFHRVMATMYPIRNALMYDIADLTQSEWHRLSAELRLREIKSETYTDGPTPKDNYYGIQGIFDLAKNPGGKDIHHDVMKFLEESGLYLLCHVTTAEFNQKLTDTHPEGHDPCGDSGLGTKIPF